MTPEAKVKAKVRNILKQPDIWYCTPATGGYGVSGVPDFLACIKGKFLGIECKAGSITKMTELQQIALFKIKEAGGHAVLINELNVEDLRKLIFKMLKGF